MSPVCGWVRDQLEPMMDGHASAVRVAEVRAHLAACADCRAHHEEASSLPSRLAAIPSPEPPPTLVSGVLRRVSGERLGALQLWGPLGVEAGLFLVAVWYLSGLRGLYRLVQITASDAGALVGWGFGQADLPAPAAGDAFLVVVFVLLLCTTLFHLSLLSRRGQLS